MPCSLQMAKLKKGASYVAELQASLQQHRNEIVAILNRYWVPYQALPAL